MKHLCIVELMPIPQTIGGVPTHILELSKSLAKKGWKISIISSRSREKLGLKIKGVDFYHVGIEHKKIEDFKGFWKLVYLFWRIFFEIFFVLGSIKLIKKLNPDIINSEGLITHAVPSIFSGKRFVCTAHGIHSDGFKKLYKLKGQNIFSIIFSALYYPLETLSASRAERVICLGKDTFEFYKKFGKCIIIPNGIDTGKFKSVKGKRENNLIFVGRFTQQKAPDKIIKAMSSLPEYNLDIIGLGPLQQEVENLCSERKNCRILGYKTQQQLPPLLNKASFIVIPSEFEGLPIAMLEAMACGCIPIATKVGDIADVIKDGKNGFLLENNKPETIARKIKSIKKANLEEIKKNTIKTALEYSWSKISDKFIKIYEESLK